MTSPDQDKAQPQEKINKQTFSLFARHNRGLLLDVSVFVANIFLMRSLTRYVMVLFDQASNNDPVASFMLLSGSIAMWVLPVAGSVLKRWHFHRRLAAEHKTLASSQTTLIGCVFNPILYFCLNLVVMAAIVAGVSTAVMGPHSSDDG